MTRYEIVKKIQDKVLELACEGNDKQLANVWLELSGDYFDVHRGEYHLTDDDGSWIQEEKS